VPANASRTTGSPAGSRWQAEAWLELERPGCGERIGFQAGASAPLKWQRGRHHGDGCLELPLLHTAGGLVGGDQLRVRVHGQGQAQALITSVAAQKVYGSVGRFRHQAEGHWSRQELHFALEDQCWVEWMPQELVMYADALLEQRLRVQLAEEACFLCADVVRLGRSAAGETLGRGCWRSRLEICRRGAAGQHWELVDALSLDAGSLDGEHGMASAPVFGNLVWVAPCRLEARVLDQVLDQARRSRGELAGELACGRLDAGLVARYRGDSSQDARYWFTRIWAAVRQACGQPRPELPRVWPFQEQPLAGFDLAIAG
jgi:urease accessory protein